MWAAQWSPVRWGWTEGWQAGGLAGCGLDMAGWLTGRRVGWPAGGLRACVAGCLAAWLASHALYDSVPLSLGACDDAVAWLDHPVVVCGWNERNEGDCFHAISSELFRFQLVGYTSMHCCVFTHAAPYLQPSCCTQEHARRCGPRLRSAELWLPAQRGRAWAASDCACSAKHLIWWSKHVPALAAVGISRHHMSLTHPLTLFLHPDLKG